MSGDLCLALRPYLPSRLTVISAALLSMWIAPWNISYTVWFCLIPWMFSLDQARTARIALVQGAWLSLFYGIFSFYFVTIGFHNAAHISYASAVLLTLPFFLLHQPQYLVFPIVFWLWKQTKPLFRNSALNQLFEVFALSSVYVAVETLIPKVFADGLGVAFHESPYLLQVADLGGIPLLTFIAFFTNLTMFRLLQSWPRINATWPAVIAAFSLIAAGEIYGSNRLSEIQNFIDHSSQILNAGLVQANIDDESKERAHFGSAIARNQIVRTYDSFSRSGLQDPQIDFLIWPETAFPEIFRAHSGTGSDWRTGKIESLVRSSQRALVFGSYDSEPGNHVFNSITILGPDLEKQVYHKSLLLPGGEYWPLEDSFPWLKMVLPPSSDFTSGPGPVLLTLPVRSGNVLVNPVICYEAIFSDYALRGARLGSQLILNLTDDSWFEPSNEPKVHLDLTVFNSVITRLPMIRSTNTGISALVLPTGELIDESVFNHAEFLRYKIPITESIPTLMKSWGNWFAWTSTISAFFLCVFVYLADRSKRNRQGQ
jgi:apolipoprotein N-acyltransferase